MRPKNELRDIYQSENTDFEKDFTPQVAQKIIEQRQRDLMRSRITSIFFGAFAIAVSIALVFMVIRDAVSRTPKDASQAYLQQASYIPRHNLPAEAEWVMDYEQAYKRSGAMEEPGEKPFSAQWVLNAAYHLITGQQALGLKEPETALRNFLKAVEFFPEIEGVQRTIGMIYIQQEEYEKAAQHLELALKEEESFSVVNNLGTAYIGTENYELAEKHLKRALELRPDNPLSHKNLAVLYKKMERADDAVFHFEKYLDLRPNDIETMQAYALYLAQLGRWASAAEFLEELTQEVTDVAPIYFLLAQVQVQNGQKDKAMEALQRGIQLVDPSLALAWMSREEFNEVREKQDFKKLVDELEIASVSLENVE